MTFRGFVAVTLSAAFLMTLSLDASAGKYGGSSRSSGSFAKSIAKSFSFGNNKSYTKHSRSSSNSSKSGSSSKSSGWGWGGSTKQSSSTSSTKTSKQPDTNTTSTKTKSNTWGGDSKKNSSGLSNKSSASTTAKNSRLASAPTKNLSKKRQEAAYNAYKEKHKSKFKGGDNPVKVSKTKASSSPIYQHAANRTSRGDYWDRRDRFYNGWHVPGYTYRGASSYGIFDGMFLGYMLSHATSPSYSSFAYHHQNDPGMQTWMREMENRSREDSQIRSQLNELKAQMARMEGTQVDPSYIPQGVDADMIMSPEMVASLTPTFRLCTAGEDGNYQRFGRIIQNAAGAGVDIQLINTAGSMENLKRMQNESCDGAYVQRNAFPTYAQRNPSGHYNFERIATPATEYAHLVCNRDSKIGDVGDLIGKSLLVGSKGSGSEVTWSDFTAMDEAYNKVNTRAIGGVNALNKVSTGQADCMLYIASLNTELMQRANQMGDRLVMVPVNDWDFNDQKYGSGKLFTGHKDQSGEEVYVFQKIPGGQYEEIQDGIFSSVETLTVPVDMVASLSWAEENPTAYNAFLSAVQDAQQEIDLAISEH